MRHSARVVSSIRRVSRRALVASSSRRRRASTRARARARRRNAPRE
jgi:hypothetical protein